MKTANYNYQQDLSKIILWQYDDAVKFKALVAGEQAFMDNAVTKFWDDFDKNIFNLSTCNTFGLELWGKLLNVARPAYTSGGTSHEYTDEQYRLVLQARIYVLTFDGSAKALNQFFKILLPEYPVAITDNYDMTVKFSFVNEPPEEIKRLLEYEGFLPRPSGVRYIFDWTEEYSRIFGFEGMTRDGEQPPSFTDADSGNFDPETDGGGTFYV